MVGDPYLDQIYNDLQNGTKKEIDDHCLHQLQTNFDCQHMYHHLHRIRYQVIELGKHQRYHLVS